MKANAEPLLLCPSQTPEQPHSLLANQGEHSGLPSSSAPVLILNLGGVYTGSREIICHNPTFFQQNPLSVLFERQ